MIFDLTVADLINVIFIAAGLGICGMSIMHVGSGVHIRKEVKVYFQLFFTLINTYISMHLIRMLMEGRTSAFCIVGIRVVTFIEFLVSGFMIYMLSLLILYITQPGKYSKPIFYIFLVLVLIHTLGLILNLFTGFYYYFDEFNVYQRGRGYVMSNIMHILMLLQNMFLMIKYKTKVNKKLASALWLYLLSPLAAIGAQILFQEIQFVILATVISAAYLYYVIVRIQLERYSEQQKEKERLDTELTMMYPEKAYLQHFS